MTDRSYVWFILLFFKFILLNFTRIGLYRVSQNWGKRRVILHLNDYGYETYSLPLYFIKEDFYLS